MSTTRVGPSSGPVQSVLAGAWRFALVSIGGFSVWAFAGQRFYESFGEVGLYAVTTVVFIALAGLLLHPLVPGPRSVARFYRLFVPAFLAYAVTWSVLWFLLGFGLGEWLGSLLGSVVFVAVCGWALGTFRSFAAACAVFFVAHSIGYFAGGALASLVFSSADGGLLDGVSAAVVGVLGKLTWGLVYGFGFGAGLGYTLHVFRQRA